MSQETNKPLFKSRIGSVSATVWERDVNGTMFHSVEIVRNYKQDEKWNKSSSFNHDELLNVAKLAERAEAFIAEQKTS